MSEKSRSSKTVAWITAGGVIVGAFVGLYQIFHKPNTDVADYRRQVIATCAQVRDVLGGKEHPEVMEFSGNHDLGGPMDLIVIRKAPLLQLMRTRVTLVRQHFDALDRKTVPPALRQQKAEARQGWNGWLSAQEALIRRVEAEVRDRDPFSRVNELEASLGAATREADVRLNNTMTTLAGEDCRATA